MKKTPSTAQKKILDRLAKGARLALEPKSGQYELTDCMTGQRHQIDQRPVAAMLRAGILKQDVFGRCSPVETQEQTA